MNRCRPDTVLRIAAVVLLAVVITVAESPAPLRLHALFSHGVVLQRGRPVPIWGTAAPGTRVRVSLGKQRAETLSNENGVWRAYLGPLDAGGPHELRVRSRGESVFVRDVLIGEVWLCSGQSNMQMSVAPSRRGAILNVDQEIASADFPNLRLFTVRPDTAFVPAADLEGVAWRSCTPESIKPFSAVAYFFGRELHRELGVPIGLINASYGGSPAEAWMSEEALRSLSDWRPMMDLLPKLVADSEKRAADAPTNASGSLQLDDLDYGYENAKPLWASPEFDSASWATVPVPGYWEDYGFPNLDGFGWYRRELELPESWADKPVRVHIGGVNDMHRAWFNGEQIGAFEETSGFAFPRAYDVPPHLVRTGRNVVAVRAYDMGNVGGFVGVPGDFYLELSDRSGATLPLAGDWKFKPGMDVAAGYMRPAPPIFVKGNQQIPGVLYNAMIAPIVPFGVRGVAWYQGENNVGRAQQYERLFKRLISDWRGRFQQGDLPFLYVQLANYRAVATDPNAPAPIAELREAQARALSAPNTGMVVTIDIGETNDIHPKNKQDVGKRLALLALEQVYGKNVVASGPTFRSAHVDGNTVRVAFSHAEGLTTADGRAPRAFAVAGADRVFHWADARIDQREVVLTCAAVPVPKYLRYAYADNPAVNLVNAAGLPAVPFACALN